MRLMRYTLDLIVQPWFSSLSVVIVKFNMKSFFDMSVMLNFPSYRQ